MGVKLVASSGGSVELVPTNTASNFTVTVPAVTASMLTDSSGVMNIGSGQVYKDSSGNVGIGTSSPGSNRLNVQGDGTNTVATFYSPSTTVGAKIVLSDNLYSAYLTSLPSGGASGLGFGTSGAERARINSSGDLFVGCTAYPSATVSGFVASAGGLPLRTSTGTYTGAGDHIQFYNGNGSVGYIRTNGTATSYVTSSDYRLKENIQPMQSALATVAQLSPVTYTWKADGSTGQGFIAHELQAVVPDCVTGEKDAVDAEGNPVYQGIDTSFLVATLTAAIQEQQALITQLQADVAALKGTA